VQLEILDTDEPATALASLMPKTATGTSELVAVPLPSWPLPLAPQQSTLPVDSRPQ
jgi:hypothetical protein